MLARASTRLPCSLRLVRLFSSDNPDPKDKQVPTKDVIDDKVLQALKDATASVHPTNTEARSKLAGAAIKKLTEIEFDSFQSATTAQTTDLMTDTLLNNLQSLQIQRPTMPSYSKDLREASQIRVALRREIFHEAVQKGATPDEAKKSAENILPVIEKMIMLRRQEKLSSIEAEIEKQEKADEALTVLDKQIIESVITKRDNVFYSDEELLLAASTESRPTVQPNKDAPSVFNDDSIRLNLFSKGLKPKSLAFWKQLDDDKARVTNLSMGPKNALEEQILWTEKGRMWPYPINNEYMIGEEENVSFMDHIFLEGYLAQHNLPKTGPVAHFMELVCVGLSKNPYMTVKKKHEHLDSFAKYFNPEYVKTVQRLHEQEQQAAANA
uniref:Small ribosomal subunit protein mS31 n=1 Tax=Panagrellus redivivus TaxID=6233 RepID=A0A7E4W279_PANRE